MFCQKCGTNNDDNATNCSNCGAPLDAIPEPTPVVPSTPVSSTAPTQEIKNYLVQSILVTLFCCLPFGIAAIVFSAQVNGKVQAGDIEGAMESSKKAKMFTWISFWVGLVAILLSIALNVAAAIMGLAQGGY